MGLNVQVLAELFLCVCLQKGYSHPGSLSGVTGAFWLVHALSSLQLCKQSMCNWTLRLAKALMSLLFLGSSEFCGIPLDQYNLDVPSAAQMSGTL